MIIFKGQALSELAEVKVKKPYNGHQLFNGKPDYSPNKNNNNGNFSTIKR